MEVKSDGGTHVLETKNVIVATGSEARMLPGLKPDARIILTNIEILSLPAIPKTMLIIGAGAVGVEMPATLNGSRCDRVDQAQAYNARAEAVVDKTRGLILLDAETGAETLTRTDYGTPLFSPDGQLLYEWT